MADGLVLVYHRVCAPGNDPFGLRVSPRHFDVQLALLRERAVPLPLMELATRARAGTLPERALAISFDDGTPDTLETALPLLQRHQVPATVFLTAAPRTTREYWWEELASLLLRPGSLPARLQLGRARWELGPDREYDGELAARQRDWRAFSGPPPTARHRLFEELWARLRPLSHAARARTLARLREWAGAPERRRGPRARPLTSEEVRRLAASGLVRVGAHTLTHPLLGALRAAAQEREIRGGRERLERMLGAEVRELAYPYGAADCFDSRTVRIARDAGFRLACSTVAGRVSAASDPLALPRVCVGDWDADDFARWLEGWLR